MLAAAIDRLEVLIATVYASAGKTPPRVKPYPRPRTAIERARETSRRARHEALVARVLPPPSEGGDET